MSLMSYRRICVLIIVVTLQLAFIVVELGRSLLIRVVA